MRHSLLHEPPDHTFWDPSLTAAPGEPTYNPLRPIASALRTIWKVSGETVGAHRTYEDLRFRRVPHDTAIRQALSISNPTVKLEPRDCAWPNRCPSL